MINYTFSYFSSGEYHEIGFASIISILYTRKRGLEELELLYFSHLSLGNHFAQMMLLYSKSMLSLSFKTSHCQWTKLQTPMIFYFILFIYFFYVFLTFSFFFFFTCIYFSWSVCTLLKCNPILLHTGISSQNYLLVMTNLWNPYCNPHT